MQLSRVQEILKELGLTDGEAKVYLAMLDLGPSGVQTIAKRAKVSRTATYDIIAALSGKGIVSSSQNGKKKLFSAEEPDQLKTYFANKVEDIKDRFEDFKDLLPELRVMRKSDTTKVRYYEGEEGIEALFRDLKTVRAKELYEFTNTDAVYENIDHERLWKLRESSFSKTIKPKVLYLGELRNPVKSATFRKIDGSIGLFSGTIWLYENRIALLTFYGRVEVIILENDTLTQTLRVLFQIAWMSSDSKNEKAGSVSTDPT